MRGRRPEVRWARVAEADLWEIVSHIAVDRPITAGEVLDAIRARAESLRAHPDRGRTVPEFQRLGIKDYRESVLPPWRIVYKADRGRIEVVAVLDSRRNVEDLLLRRLTRSE
jgi:plasmid stabilization system protein ParE